jgi:hypothetical protein
VFQDELWSPEGEKGGKKRRNIVNVNYVTVQLLRLESEEVFQAWGKYFPQLTSKKQPRMNNERWQILMKGCRERYEYFSFQKTEEVIYLGDWEYKELTPDLIKDHCQFFH